MDVTSIKNAIKKTRGETLCSSVPFLIRKSGNPMIGWFTYSLVPAGYTCSGNIHKLFTMNQRMETVEEDLEREITLHAFYSNDDPVLEEEDYLARVVDDFNGHGIVFADYRSAIPTFMEPLYEVARRAAFAL